MSLTPGNKVDERVYNRDNFRCKYCGFDGRAFDHWMQLSIDHVLPRSHGGGHGGDNKVVCCGSCNSITSRMKFPKEMAVEEIIQRKIRFVSDSRKKWLERWKKMVVPEYLKTA